MRVENPLPGAVAALRRDIEAGQSVGAQLYVSRAGEVIADLAEGEARGGRPLAPDDLMLWMSCVKPAMGVAILQLRERGLLDLDDPVALHIPEFARNGKERVSLRHVLTHTGGFRTADPRWGNATWSEVVEGLCAASLDPGAAPGEQSAYHVAGGWYVLGEVVRRLDGRDYATYVREEVFAPLGARDSWAGMPAEAHAGYGDRIVPMHDGSQSPPQPAVYWPFAGTARGCAISRPGGSAWGPIRELAWLFEALLAGGVRRGQRLLAEESVSLMTHRHTEGMRDAVFEAVLDRGLGLVIDSRHHPGGGNWFGNRCSRSTFGHGGFGCAVAFADPESQLAVGLVFNGMLPHEKHEERMRVVVDAIYADID